MNKEIKPCLKIIREDEVFIVREGVKAGDCFFAIEIQMKESKFLTTAVKLGGSPVIEIRGL